MEVQAKIYIIFVLVFLVLILQMANARRRANRSTQFPFMINAFSADYSAMNPLKIAYFLKQMGMSFEFFPILSNEIIEFINPHERDQKFNSKKSQNYFIMLNVHFTQGDVNKFIDEFRSKFEVVKIDKRMDGASEIFIKEKFTHFNLERMTFAVTAYLKKENPLEFKTQSLSESTPKHLQ